MMTMVWGERNTYSLLVGVQSGETTMEISVGVTTKAKNICTTQSHFLTRGHIPKVSVSCSSMFIAGLLTREHGNRIDVCELIKDNENIYTMDYYSVLQINIITKFAIY